jgi:2-polyprenyl-3-methyl-5-hydroxy-6-metoxy-1,4-benzoquinol methylase
MLDQHLSQKHDSASRRFEIINKQVEWIHNQVLKRVPTRVLDLGCGPGFYTNRLARLGHRCVGIDFSPASIEYAREQVEETGLECTYIHEDLRTAEFGDGYGLVMSIFGEFNVFRTEEAKALLQKAWSALVPKGLLLLEPHTIETVVKIGKEPSSWYAAERGLFSEEPHLCLQENFWNREKKAAIQRYYVINAATGEVARHSATTQAYTNEEYLSVLALSGFRKAVFYPSLGGNPADPEGDLIGILSQKEVQ